MSLEFQSTIDSLSELNMWYKLQNDTPTSLFDMPEIIRLRWDYFRDSWTFIRQDYIDLIDSYSEPDVLKDQINTFDNFIIRQRNTNKNPFDNDDVIFKFYAIFDSTLLNNITLTKEEQTILANKVSRINDFSRGDFLFIRNVLREERDMIADRASATDVDYNKVYNRKPQTARVELKNKDINKMFQLQESIKAVDFILANIYSLSTATVDPFALARQNAQNDDINIGDYASGTLVKLNYGEDLQSLAARTLGDADRWIDIAIANGLKAPYIDEVGEKITLISTASGNQINIGKLDTNGNLNIDKLSIGQIVTLQSDAQTFPDQRTIIAIKEIPVSGEIVLELSGANDLDKYELIDNANVRIYKQNTVNSSLFILIPSDEQLDDDLKTQTPWFLKGIDIVDKRQKIDLLMSDTGDLVFNSTGDLQVAYGLENSMQALKLKLAVELGELRRHPEYGLVPIAGNTNKDIDSIKEIITESIVSNIEADERYAAIDRLTIDYNNSAVSNSAAAFSIILVVRLANSDQLMPISFSVNI